MFYIICVNEKEDWWQLRLKGSHVVLSCNHTKGKILECLYNIVKRYGKAKNLRSAVAKMEMYNEGSTNLEKYQQEYLEVGHLYEADIEEIVRQAEEEIKEKLIQDSPVVKNKKRLSSLRKPHAPKKETTPTPISVEKEEEKRPLLPKKRIGLKKVKPLRGRK